MRWPRVISCVQDWQQTGATYPRLPQIRAHQSDYIRFPMDIDVTPELREDAADAGPSAPVDQNISPDRVLQHRALCQLGLPLQPCADAWRRDIGTVALAIEMPAGGKLPHGALLRRLLLHMFSTALANGSPAVEIGANAAVLAERMGFAADAAGLQALGEQYERLVASKMTVALDGGMALGVFDARGRPRAVTEWRSAVRLNARFFAGLSEGAVALDRGVVAALSARPLALDAYMWLAYGLANTPDEGLAGASWEDLYGRFGDQGQTPEAFRAAFEDCLREVTVACPAIVVIMGEQEVQVRAASPARAAAPVVHQQPVAPRPAPVAAPEPAAEPEPQPEVSFGEAAEPGARQGGRQGMQQGSVQQSNAQPGNVQQSVGQQSISLKSHITGLAQVVWLQRANGRENQVIEVTPGGRYDPDNVTVLALEPLVVQISGGLYDREFERVSTWAMSNRDLIDDVWDGKIGSFDEVTSRVKKVPAPGWR